MVYTLSACTPFLIASGLRQMFPSGLGSRLGAPVPPLRLTRATSSALFPQTRAQKPPPTHPHHLLAMREPGVAVLASDTAAHALWATAVQYELPSVAVVHTGERKGVQADGAVPHVLDRHLLPRLADPEGRHCQHGALRVLEVPIRSNPNRNATCAQLQPPLHGARGCACGL